MPDFSLLVGIIEGTNFFGLGGKFAKNLTNQPSTHAQGSSDYRVFAIFKSQLVVSKRDLLSKKKVANKSRCQKAI